MSSSRRDLAESSTEMTYAPLRHPGRWAVAVALVVVLAAFIQGAVTNDAYGWSTVAEYLFDPRIIAGLGTTLLLTVVAMSCGSILGVILAIMRNSENRVLVVVAGGYIWFFRGTPLLVQLIFWFNLSALYPELGLGLPFLDPVILFNTNELISVWTAAILGLSLNEAAYMAEIARGGLLAVDGGQREAAQALGMSPGETLRRIILPQAIRVMIPPTGNQLIGMLKYTSLVSVIALPDLLYSAQLIYSQNFQTIPLLIVVSIWYLVCTSVLSVGQWFLERRFGRGFVSTRAVVRRPDVVTVEVGNG